MSMTTLTYQASFNTPAFLGNAEQQAQWRTPPFKALLRQWWRVVKAPDVGYDHSKLLALENKLFGSALDGGGSGRSKVQLRLSGWDEGKETVAKGVMVDHRESPIKQVGSNLYLGYGPLGGDQTRSAIKAGSQVHIDLSIRCPDENIVEISRTMQLIAWFGTLGSRSRNGWGSLHLGGVSAPSLLGFHDLADAKHLAEASPTRPLSDCLTHEWRTALGTDGTSPLIWRLFHLGPKNAEGKITLEPFSKWEDAMHELARIKIAVRTSEFFSFAKHGGGKAGHPQPLPRHVLAYPSGGNHKVDAANWGDKGRMANQVIFKVHRWKTGYTATIAHFPVKVPQHMAKLLKLPDPHQVWREVHRLLDAERSRGLLRVKGMQA